MSSYCFVEQDGVKVRAWFRHDFETYHVGDTVPWVPSFYSAGDWINGFHEAEREDDSADPAFAGMTRPYWVVIHEQKVVALVPDIVIPEAAKVDRDGAIKILRKMFPWVQESPPCELWPDQAWEYLAHWWDEVHRQTAESVKEMQAYVEKAVERWRNWKPDQRKDPTPKAVELLNNPLYAMLSEWPKTEEEARERAEAEFCAGEYMRSKVHERGIYRQLFPRETKDRPDLTALIEQDLHSEFQTETWQYGWDMLIAAVNWRAGQLLVKHGIEIEGKDKSFHIGVRCSQNLPDLALHMMVTQSWPMGAPVENKA